MKAARSYMDSLEDILNAIEKVMHFVELVWKSAVEDLPRLEPLIRRILLEVKP